MNKQIGKHEAITHYTNKYGYIPPFVLVKILTLGELNRLYAILSQSDRQAISKEFKLSDKVLRQIIQNMTMVRNICAHNDRLFSFHSKFLISFKYIDKNYLMKEKSTNLYMIIKSMMCLLDDNKSNKFDKELSSEINKLSKKLKSINIDVILTLMGFPMNK